MDNFKEELKQKEQLKTQTEDFEDKAKRLVKAFEDVLKTKSGRVVVKAILETCPIDEECFCVDPNKTAYMLGKRAIGVELRNYLKNNLSLTIMQNIEKETI